MPHSAARRRPGAAEQILPCLQAEEPLTLDFFSSFFFFFFLIFLSFFFRSFFLSFLILVSILTSLTPFSASPKFTNTWRSFIQPQPFASGEEQTKGFLF